MTHIVLFGNEKGGSGKTTYAIHTIISLLNMGFKVASIDLDERQQSLSRYIENRQKTISQTGINFPLPEHFQISRNASAEHSSDYENMVLELIENLENYDYLVIDAPGSNTKISRFAHVYADTVITPINSSFIDIDLLGKVDANNLTMISTGIYSNMYIEERKKRQLLNKQTPDWIVVHSRYSLNETLNRRSVDFALRCIAKDLQFRTIKGFTDRTIFKDLFLQGLTLLDSELTKQIKITPSTIAARQEVRSFLYTLKLPMVIPIE